MIGVWTAWLVVLGHEGPAMASPSPAAAPIESTSTNAPVPPKDSVSLRPAPRLVLAFGPLMGPHAVGNRMCNTEQRLCETKGSFLGMGAQLELRIRTVGPLFAHMRGLALANVSPNERIYRGMLGAGTGFGAYGRRIFGRAEYLWVHPFGDNRFEPPFFTGKVAHDRWGNHAGMVVVGFRQPLPRGLAVELWTGPMFGPHSVRQIPQSEPDERVLFTFMLGVNVSWDVRSHARASS